MRIDLGIEEDIAAAVRGANGESLVVVIAPGRDTLSQAMVEAAVAPLAIERAPAMRVNAVLPQPGADPGAVEAAVAFLAGARSTTGQLVTVS